MTFKELYEIELHKPSAASQFVKRIAEVTHRREMTVRMWLNGRQQPDDLVKSVIAETLGVEPDVLFPSSDKSNN